MTLRQVTVALWLIGCLLRVTYLRADETKTNAGMIEIPGGVFKPLFRSVTDAPEIKVAPFLLEKYPVTNEEFLEFVKVNSRWRRSAVKRLFADESYLKTWAGDLELGTNAGPRAPVTFVSWFAAKSYAQWKGKRLPTVAEWEFVAGASRTQANGESDPEFRKELAGWYSTLSSARLPAVGSRSPNYWGVHDLHGLVWEWVSDFNTAMVTGDARGDTGLDRQLFCGSASVGARDPSNYFAFMRYGFRSSLNADYCVHNLGFRCAADFKEEIK
jgi:formylglycine-generating enzyme required for sulfatase activity